MTDAGSTLVPDWLRQRARLTPARMALLCDGDHWTFAELEARALRTAAALASLGLKAGDHLGLLARNSPEFVQAVWGAISLRLVLVPLNTRLKAAEVEYQVRDARIQVLVAGSEDWNTAQDVAEAMPGLRVLSLEEITGDEKVPAALDLAEMVDLTAVQGVMYTSGTTGQPKGAMLTYGNHFWSAAGSMLNLGLSDSDRWLVSLPLFHIGGLSTLFKSVIYGMTVVLHRTFDEGAVSRSLDEDGITAISVVATMLRRLLAVREGKPPPAALRCVLLGGGPIPPDLVDACLSSGLPVAPTYGLTESCSQATTLAPRDVSTRAASAGKPLFPVEVRIVDGAAIGLPEGAEGEILLRGPTITPGYLGRPEESDRLLAGGWLHTGDWGRVDSEGFLHVLDRRDDIVITGGENVYPAEVEALLLTNPAVADAGVYAIPDAEWGHVVGAAVVLREGHAIEAQDLREFCLARAAHYKAPRVVSFVPALPRNAMGKLMRRDLGDKSP